MKTFLHLLYKDFLLLIRDKIGMVLIFLMPLALVLIMTSMQDGVMSVDLNTHISLLVLNHDNDSIGNKMESELSNSDVFNTHLADDIDTAMLEKDLKALITKGDYLVGVYIPDSTTIRYTHNFKAIIENALKNDTTDSISSGNDSVLIKIFIDPTVKPSVYATLISNIREFSMEIQHQYALKELSKVIEELSGNHMKDLHLEQTKGLEIDEQIADELGQDKLYVSSVQHNVPAWTLFAIFFIVVSFSGNMIKEREEGSFNRLMTMPCSYTTYLFSKMFLYLFVCILQFLMIIAMGVWLFPCINLEAFIIEGNFFKLLFIVLFAAGAAIAYGTLISTIAGTQQQAAIFGSVSVVILSALGGVWIPTFAMPDFLKYLSHISPLNWGLEASYDIILRKASISEVFPECLYLTIFALLCFSIAIIYKKYQNTRL